MRRAMPSSSIIAIVDKSWPDRASSTERPDNSRTGLARQLCVRMSVSDTLCRASEIVRPIRSWLRYSRSAKISRGDIFVGPDEVANGQREAHFFRNGERIDTKLILEPRHQDGEGQRIEAGFLRRQIVLKR